MPGRAYQPLSFETNRAWNYFVGSPKRPQPPAAGAALREGLALNDHLKVWINHGVHDLQTPYFESDYILANLGLEPSMEERVLRTDYWGGHMFYTHGPSSAAFGEDAAGFYAALLE
jgi:carboxypeptidase C (cathepsin A)